MGDLTTFSDDIDIDGGSGINQMYISNFGGDPMSPVITSQMITGLLPVNLFYRSSGGRFGMLDGSPGGINITGSNNGNDIFDILGLPALDSMRIDGMDGNDTFFLRPGVLGQVMMAGGEGSDKYRLGASDSGARQAQIEDFSDLPSRNRISYFGNDANESFQLTSSSLSNGSEMTQIAGNFAFIEVVGFAGDDTYDVSGSPALTTYLLGQEDNDQFTVNGTTNITGLRLVG